MLNAVQEPVRARRLAHAQLDSEHAAYRREQERFYDNALADLLADPPVRDVRTEARRLIAERYSDGICQCGKCDNCHRLRALLKMSALCDSRKEYRAIMDWIMDPAFLA